MRHEPIDITTENRRLPAGGGTAFKVGIGLALLGAVLAAVSFGTGDGARLAWAYHVNYVYFLSLALGALFFVLIQHVTHAGWSVVVRRLAEAVAANLPWLALGAVPVVLHAGAVFHWAHHGAADHDKILAAKAPYLNLPFFTIRLVVYFAVWSALAILMHRWSVRQDRDPDPALTLRMERWAAPGIILFALTCTFAAFDLLMSLDPHWFSSIFGVYFFAGCFLGFMALLALMTRLTQRSGRLTHAITREHWHDIGKFTFAFVVFWAYIAFSQYMLIWYANLPEETVWYHRRQQGGWTAVSIALLVLHFIVPFVLLLSRLPKRRPLLMTAISCLVLVMHWVDIYWMAMPEMNREAVGVVPLHLADLAFLVLLGGIFIALTARRLAANSLVAEGDPRLPESLTFENV